MIKPVLNHDPHLKHRCFVCGELLNGAPADNDDVCLNQLCRHVINQKKHMNDVLFRHYLEHQSKHIKEINKREALKKTELQKKHKRDEKDYIRFIIRRLKEFSRYTGNDPAYIMVPDNSRHITPLTEKRRYEFHLFLTALIQNTFINPAEEVKKHETHSCINTWSSGNSFLNRICSFCGGNCCNPGGEQNAFLGKDTLYRYQSDHPALQPDLMKAAYMLYIGEKTYTDSCVYHTRNGCHLPRNMRSDTCNTFRCDALISADNHFREKKSLDNLLLVKQPAIDWKEKKESYDILSHVLLLR